MPDKAKVSLVSLGCPKNLVDSQVMLGFLQQAGYPIVEDVADADVIIVNTCAFIAPAEEEAIEALLDLAEYKHDNCRALICAGCLVQRHKRELIDELPEVDAFLGVGAVPRIVEATERALAGDRVLIDAPLPYVYDSSSPWLHTGPEWLAYLKIADGCNHRCTFCTIPHLRGEYRSVRPHDVVERFRALVAEGVREVILVGQDTSVYGSDLPQTTSLAQLLDDLAEVEFDGWIRVMYLHPDTLDDETIAAMCSGPPVVPYFDLPLQHAASQTLRAMGRSGNAQRYLKLIETIRDHDPDAAIRTTFIVGFPGEGESQFQTLLDFVQQAQFDRVSVFPYWPEDGTAAVNLPDRPPRRVAQQRLDELMRVQEDISIEINQGFVGRTMRVLVARATAHGDTWYGRSYRDAPDIDAEVRLAAGSNVVKPRPGQFVNARVEQAEVHDLHATILTAG